MEKAGLQDFDIIYHLVSVPGALAEREPALGRRVNLDATLDLFDRLAASGRRPRVIYASSVAVYGEMEGQSIGAHSPTRPTSTYGAHKRMAEMALADHSRRGGLSGIALRLPGLIARHGKTTGFGSAFMSELPRAYAAAEPYVCPVSEQATAWWMSVSCAASNLARAASIESAASFSFRRFDCRSPRSSMHFPIFSGRIAGRSFRSIQTSASRRCLAAFRNWRPQRKRPSALPTTERR